MKITINEVKVDFSTVELPDDVTNEQAENIIKQIVKDHICISWRYEEKNRAAIHMSKGVFAK